MRTEGRAPIVDDVEDGTGGREWRSSHVGTGRGLPAVLLWVALAGSAAGVGFMGQRLGGPAGTAGGAPSVVSSPEGSVPPAIDEVARQAGEWERRYREMYPTTMTDAEREHYRDWQRQYEKVYPQD